MSGGDGVLLLAIGLVFVPVTRLTHKELEIRGGGCNSQAFCSIISIGNILQLGGQNDLASTSHSYNDRSSWAGACAGVVGTTLLKVGGPMGKRSKG